MNYIKSDIFKQHQKLGFPELPKPDQISILFYEDISCVQKLLPEHKNEGFPSQLAKFYVKLTREDIYSFISEGDFIEKSIRPEDNLHQNGTSIHKLQTGEIVETEIYRGTKMSEKVYNNRSDLVNELTNRYVEKVTKIKSYCQTILDGL